MPPPAARPPRLPRRALHGVLLLDKPLGWSSNDALQKVKGMLRAEKAGHTGTLDPLASGLLPLCFGAATKFSQVSLEADKTYRATLQLGETRVGGDREGEVLARQPEALAALDEARVRAACAARLGPQDQVPPMQSALKHEGRALYELARAGVEVERQARRITLHRLDILQWQAERLEIDVQVSKGTYIRVLAEDLGRDLGCGAHLAGLRRLGSGPLSVDDAITIEALQALEPDAREARLLPPDALLAHWPAVQLPADEAARFLTGLRRRLPRSEATEALARAPGVRVYGPAAPEALAAGRPAPSFLGSATVVAGELIPQRLLSPPEVQALAAGPAPMPERPPDPPAVASAPAQPALVG